MKSTNHYNRKIIELGLHEKRKRKDQCLWMTQAKQKLVMKLQNSRNDTSNNDIEMEISCKAQFSNITFGKDT